MGGAQILKYDYSAGLHTFKVLASFPYLHQEPGLWTLSRIEVRSYPPLTFFALHKYGIFPPTGY